MTIGYRPKGESGPAYHPDRDLAYVTPTLMAAAIASMESDTAAPDEQAWKKENNIAAEEIAAAADALARAQRDFVNAADPVTSFTHALDRRDFLDIRYPVRQFLFAAIGQTFCAAWFTAVREVSRVNEESPAARGIADFIAATRNFMGVTAVSDAKQQTIAHLQLKNDVLQSRLNTLYAEYAAIKDKLAQAQKPTEPTKPTVPKIPKNAKSILDLVITFLSGK
jgi:hypothetical protein